MVLVDGLQKKKMISGIYQKLVKCNYTLYVIVSLKAI